MTETLLGQKIRNYRIVDTLGKGGMGQVYVGYDEKLERRVALKSIRAEYRLEAEAKARFLLEARVLSQLEHPNICQIFDYIDGDENDFLVLELVRGGTLTEAIRKGADEGQKLAIAIELAQVMGAVHEQGVVHRDMKPDNIMLTEDGHVKVLDFGLSRSLTEDETFVLTSSDSMPDRAAAPTEGDQTLNLSRSDRDSQDEAVRTRAGSTLGTLGYMSPEQARGETVTAASDIYSLGLIYQELFSGSSPHETGSDSLVDRLEKAKRGESLPVEGIDSGLAALIEQMKALEPGARPRAREALDRLLWFRDRPARRRRKALAILGIALLSMVAVGSTWQAIRIAQEKGRADEEAVRASREAESAKATLEVLTSLFEVSDPGESRGNTITAREVLDHGREKLDALGAQPLVKASLMVTLGEIYRKLGLYELALPLLEDAVSLRREHMRPDHPEVGRSLNNLALLYKDKGEYAEAERLFGQALEIREKALGPDDPKVAGSLNNLANLYVRQGKYSQAEPLFKRSLEIREKALGAGHSKVAASLNNLANLYLRQKKYAEAEPLYKRSLIFWESSAGPPHPNVAAILNNLASLYREQGNNVEAEKFNLRSLDILREIHGPDHPVVAVCMSNLGRVYADQGKYAEAEPLYLRSLDISEKVLGSNHPDVARSLNNLAYLYTDQDKHAEAEPLYLRSLEIWQEAVGGDHPEVAFSLYSLAFHYAHLGNHAEAEPLYLRSLEVFQKALGPAGPEVADCLYRLGCLSSVRGNPEKALDYLRRAVDSGWEDLSIEDDSDLSSLHGDPEFKQIIEIVRQRAQGKNAE